VQQEVARLRRARASAKELGALRVTHCPVCDRALAEEAVDLSLCYLCRRPLNVMGATRAAEERLSFEGEQLEDEERELRTLIGRFEGEREVLDRELGIAQEEIDKLEATLQAPRSTAALLVADDVSVIDRERGAIDEQLRQVERIRKALELQQNLTRQIDEVSAEAEGLGKQAEDKRESADLEAAGDAFGSAMNDYFNAINQNTIRWPEGRVSVRIRDRSVRFLVGGESWSRKLGATLKCYFLCAYQYALLGLLAHEGAQYPGLCILDFPPTLTDGSRISDSENYLVEPFIQLLKRPDMSRGQLIVAGQAFEGLQTNRREELGTVWR
jgi:hypothetical protein